MTVATDKPLTALQAAFVQNYTDPGSATVNNATQAAIAAGYSKKTAQQISTENLSKPVISKAIAAYKAEMAKELGLSRIDQFFQLDRFINQSYDLKQPAAGISGIREKNTMLGFRQENAPNTEHQQAILTRMTAEMVAVAELMAQQRIHTESVVSSSKALTAAPVDEQGTEVDNSLTDKSMIK